MSEFITKSSGEKQEFETGAKRDTQDGKARYDLIPVPALKRLAELYARGACRYGENNWQKGMPFRRMLASLMRHLFQYLEGEPTEDHLAAVAFGIFGLMSYEQWIRDGKLPATLNDLHPASSSEK